MGVRRLTNYVHYLHKIWTEIQLKDTLIVVDGLALLWFLYIQDKIDCRCGGEYDEFAKTIRGYFHALTSKGVKPYVLIDGPNVCPSSRTENEILSSSKLSTDDCDAFVLPLMAKLVFVQELKNLGIPIAVCDGEADRELAALANHWNCPVLSKDSDFFIYNLPAGYIPLSSLDMTRGPIVTAKLFKRQRLASHLRIHEDFFPLFASLMGNDYVEEETLAPFKKALIPELAETDSIGARALIMNIANFISRYRTPSEALQSAVDLAPNFSVKANLKEHVETSMAEYKILDNSLRGYFEQNETRTRRETRHNKAIPAYVIRSYRDGRFPIAYFGALFSSQGIQVLKVQVEETSEESAHMCSVNIRQISYGIVTEGPTVLEFDREDAEMVGQEFPPFFGTIPGYGKMPNLKNLREVDTSQRLKLLLIVLRADTALIKWLPESFQMFAASVRYWISKANPGVNQIWVQALLLVHLKLLADNEDEASVKSKQSNNQEGQNRRLGVPFDIKCQHGYAQWQAVMMEALLLNQILIFPLPEPNIANLYSGITAQTIAQKIKQGAQVDSFVQSVALYKQLYMAITQGLENKLVQ